MPRAIWKGAISFGLVHIPVELYPAESRKGLDLDMLDKRDFAPVGYKRYNKETGKEVDWDHIVKGYEYEKDQYVVVSDEDLKRANVEATQTIDILSFTNADEIPSIYFEQPYYLKPARGGAKVYVLLRETLNARVAGVGEVIVCSPPGRDGRPSAVVLAAAALGGADRVFAVGGAGAIAAMAYGTASVPRVDRIVGPGNASVAAAKLQVVGAVAIGSWANPPPNCRLQQLR